MKKDYSNTEILVSAIYQQETAAYKYIRQRFFSMAYSIVGKNGGSDEDVKNVFDEGMFAIAEKAYKETLDTSAEIGTFLFDIWCKMWAKELRDRGSDERNVLCLVPPREWTPEEALDRSVYIDVIWQCYEELNKNCQEIIKHVRDEVKYKEIARRMSLTIDKVKKRILQCKEEWLRLVKGHPAYLKSGDPDPRELN